MGGACVLVDPGGAGFRAVWFVVAEAAFTIAARRITARAPAWLPLGRQAHKKQYFG